MGELMRAALQRAFVFALGLWIALQLMLLWYTTSKLAWGNLVDCAVYHRRVRAALPASWAALGRQARSRFRVDLDAATRHAASISQLDKAARADTPKLLSSGLARKFALAAASVAPLPQWSHAPAWMFDAETIAFVRALLAQRLGPARALTPRVFGTDGTRAPLCVLHLRLGDVPYQRNPFYELPTRTCMRDALRVAADALPGRARVMLLASCTHNATPHEAASSRALAAAIADDLGIAESERVIDGDDVSDLRFMRDAAARITFASSFAFYAALGARDDTLWVNVSARPLAGARAGIVDLPLRTLAHARVPDYHDVPRVVEFWRHA